MTFLMSSASSFFMRILHCQFQDRNSERKRRFYQVKRGDIYVVEHHEKCFGLLRDVFTASS